MLLSSLHPHRRQGGYHRRRRDVTIRSQSSTTAHVTRPRDVGPKRLVTQVFDVARAADLHVEVVARLGCPRRRRRRSRLRVEPPTLPALRPWPLHGASEAWLAGDARHRRNHDDGSVSPGPPAGWRHPFTLDRQPQGGTRHRGHRRARHHGVDRCGGLGVHRNPGSGAAAHGPRPHVGGDGAVRHPGLLLRGRDVHPAVAATKGSRAIPERSAAQTRPTDAVLHRVHQPAGRICRPGVAGVGSGLSRLPARGLVAAGTRAHLVPGRVAGVLDRIRRGAHHPTAPPRLTGAAPPGDTRHSPWAPWRPPRT